MHILCFPENERITPILLWDGCYWFTEYGIVGDGGGCGGVGRGRSIVVGVTGFKLTISMCSLIR